MRQKKGVTDPEGSPAPRQGTDGLWWPGAGLEIEREKHKQAATKGLQLRLEAFSALNSLPLERHHQR